MRAPRRITISDEMMAKHDLSPDEPPPGSLFWKMWDACQPIAEEALDTEFVQGIGSGMLNPIYYGAFNVSDAYYCFNGATDYQIATDRAIADPPLAFFLAQKAASYAQYNQSFSDIWRISGPSCLNPYQSCKDYAEFEAYVASTASIPPIYCLVVMLPCEYLWAWLASQLAAQPPAPNNLYASWITDNNDPTSAYAIGNFLNQYPQIDADQALEYYATAMKGELANFQSATPPLPPLMRSQR